MKNLLLPLLLVILHTSCSTNRKIPNRKLNNLAIGKEFYFKNQTCSILDPTITQQLDFKRYSNDSIRLTLLDPTKLQLGIRHPLGGWENYTIKGKLKRKHFEVYLQKQKTGIAPFYRIVKIKKRRISLNNESDLIINSYNNHSGMIFFFAGGSSTRFQDTYKSQ